MQNAQIVGFRNLSQKEIGVGSQPVKNVRLHAKILYEGKVWELTEKEPIGKTKSMFSVTLERGCGNTSEKRQFRSTAHMKLRVHS